MSSLQEYLEALSSGDSDWRRKYERTTGYKFDPENPWPYLEGHYGQMLEDVVEIVGVERLLILVEGRDERIAKLQEERDAARRAAERYRDLLPHYTLPKLPWEEDDE